MIRAKAISADVYVADEPIVKVGRSAVQFLKERVLESGRKRVRLCAHKDIADRLQEMIIVFGKSSYIRPSRHIGKEESVHIIEGVAEFVFLDGDGRVTDAIPLGAFNSGREFYCRTPESVYHTLIIRSDIFVVQETTQGPFRRSDTTFASWAPEDSDAMAVGRYMTQLTGTVDEFLRLKTQGIQATPNAR